MIRSLLACLCLLCSLPVPRVTAQVPTAVRLLPGDYIDREMYGLDSATYYAAVAYLTEAPKLLAEGRAQVTSLQQQVAIGQASEVVLRKELLRARAEGDLTNARFDKLNAQNQQLSALPLQKPLLADPRTYKVGGIFTLLGVVGGLLLHK